MKSTTKTTEAFTLLAEAGQATLGQAVETFLRLAMVGKSEQTAHWYAGTLGMLIGHLGADRPLVGILEVDLAEWMAFIAGERCLYAGSLRPDEIRKPSPHTVAGYARSVKRLFSWLHKKGYLEADPSRDIEVPATPKIGRKGISDRDAAAMLEAARESPRDYALLRFVESTGCREGGVAGLRLEDLNLDAREPGRRQATVREKGDKERIVFLTDEALSAMELWLSDREKLQNTILEQDAGAVFLGGSPGQPQHSLKPNGIYEIFKRIAREAGVKKNWSPHQWRHRFGRKMAQKGMNLGVLSQIMGHSTVNITVKHYGQFAVNQLQEAFDRYSGDE